MKLTIGFTDKQIQVAAIIPLNPKSRFFAKKIANGIFTKPVATEVISWMYSLPMPLMKYT
jgi:hypothetical protein